jgi:hypothetical protein
MRARGENLPPALRDGHAVPDEKEEKGNNERDAISADWRSFSGARKNAPELPASA